MSTAPTPTARGRADLSALEPSLLFAWSGAAWAVVFGALSLVGWLGTALGLSVPAPLGIGRLHMAAVHVGLWGALGLPSAGALLDLVGRGRHAPPAARWALIVWNLGVGAGALAVLAGWSTPAPWVPAPAPAMGVVAVGAGLWVWSLVTLGPRGGPFGAAAGACAAVGLLASALVATSAGAASGSAQALLGAVGGRAALDLWLAPAAIGIAAAALPAHLGRPLYARRMLTTGWWAYLALAALATPRDLAPDLLPAWLVRTVEASSILVAAPAVVLAVSLLGVVVGRPAAAPSGPASMFLFAGVATWAASVVATASGHLGAALAALPPGAVTAPTPLPAFGAALLLAWGAAYAVFDAPDDARDPDPMPVPPAGHLALALAAAVAGAAAVWPWALAEAASGPAAPTVRAAAAWRVPGAALALVAALVLVANLVSRRSSRAIRWAQPSPESPDPVVAAGVAATVLAAALFAVVFLPLADPGFRTPTARAGWRVPVAGGSAEEGYRIYVADGCASCHTQRVRDVPADLALGPPTRAGDFAGSAAVGLRRAGPDLAWVGDRRPDHGSMEGALQAHGPDGAVPLPGLVGAEGLTAAGLSVVDYLLLLRSGGGTPR